MNSAFKLFMSNKYVLRPCIEEKVRRNLELIDYETNELAARKHINIWIQQRTHDHIKCYLRELPPECTATIVST